MPPYQVAIIVSIFACVDAIVLYAVASMCASIWNDLARRYPINEHATGPWREFQSIGIDIFNFGFCVHICADDRYIHLAPTRVLRLLRVNPVSVPRDAMTDIKPGMFKTAKVKIPKHTLTLPRWAAMREHA